MTPAARAGVACAAALLTALPPSPARAVPPYSVTGSGVVSPGLSLGAAESWFSFSGTATDVLGATSPCEFTGTVSGASSGAAGTASGTCAGVAYPTCFTTMSVAEWKLACTPPGTGAFVLSPDSTTHMTSFQATGSFA